MKSSLYSKFLAVTMALFLAATAFAASGVNKADFKISDPVQVGDKQLPAGDYVAKWKGEGPNVQVELTRNGDVLATVNAQVVALDQKARQDVVEVTTSGGGSRTLTGLQFAGKKYGLQISGVTSQAEMKTDSAR
jgi:hypothetical protein